MRSRVLIPLLLFCAAAFAPALCADEPASEREPEVEVYFVDQVGLPPSLTNAVRDELQEIYRNAGVHVLWFNTQAGAPGHPVSGRFVRVVLAWKRAFGKNFFRPKPDGRNTALGAGWRSEGESELASTVLLPYENLLEASRNSPIAPATAPSPVFTRVMARVVAHEIGHVLMNRTAHSASGLMRPDFPQNQLASPFLQDFTFNPEDAAAIRRGAKAPPHNAADTQDK